MDLSYFCCMDSRCPASFVPPFTRDSLPVHLDILWNRSWCIIYPRPETDEGLFGRALLKIEKFWIFSGEYGISFELGSITACSWPVSVGSFDTEKLDSPAFKIMHIKNNSGKCQGDRNWMLYPCKTVRRTIQCSAVSCGHSI